MSAPKKRRIGSILRWLIAIVGITYVLWNIRFHDRVRVITPGPDFQVSEVRVWNDAGEKDATFVIDADQRTVLRSDLWTLPDRKTVETADPQQSGKTRKWKLIAVRPAGDLPSPAVELLVEDGDSKQRQIIPPAAVVTRDPIRVTYPLVEVGVSRMVREADWSFLAVAILLMPLSYLLTSYRWHVLLKSQQIRIGMARTFVINMVGAFYNSFMPGSTGGDLAKAYYASKYSEHRTRAILTVVVDRIIGLLALFVLGGVLAAFQWHVPECRKVAIAAGIVVTATAAGLLVFYTPALRRGTGLDWLLGKLPMQKQVGQAVHAMELYGKQPRVIIWAFLCSFPVHVTTILSATMSGQAFHLPLSPLYYWVIVPVIALVGAIPISPQGAGVMEFFAVQLTIHRGVTVAQAVALVMSIRLVTIFWNVLAGIFVLKGGYHAPTEAEQHELEDDGKEADTGSVPRPAPATNDVVAADKGKPT
ncbi:lysylphosphatidylglycerol synthase transmembrane domain-containing protein [Humisphaera borealis]|uniref:Flippase-like domain-containing protein n=1 Tax=Humisphaera borealis TaxID=2807512 RepID=A0A7M2WZE6_9BACT|nr:lysylphosphatidylglycerol synthase transmembrane domain-containing protein [Humisphaera borealis]QOV90734.1 flippase-like domain-containing protein [Humisphaera borealis]